ncbi:MAG: glycosyl transferase, partial [Anaerolineales bacterium]
MHKTRDGAIRIWDPFPGRRAAWMIVAALLAGGLAALAGMGLGAPLPSTLMAGMVIGLLLGGIWMRRSHYGVERGLLQEHARWLVSDETVLILEAPQETLASAVDLLREGGEVPPIVYFFHPKRKRETPVNNKSAGGMGQLAGGIGQLAGVSLPLAQLADHARLLAADHRLGYRPALGILRGPALGTLREAALGFAGPRLRAELLERVLRARRFIHEVAGQLSVASRLEQATPPLAEWILDNEYIVEANARDIQLNLPRRFYRNLPVLLDGSARSLPRIYGLAQELVSHTDYRLDRENILAFVEAYQSVHPLTIGELWAYPQILRIALIENIQALADKALAELRERELADFWANRLMTVSRRDPNQLFAMMAELTHALPVPSTYFASQLIDHLYDEEAALGPVQGWLELTFHRPLAELNLREQNRQTREQISIRNAITSLRQLALLDWRGIFEDLSHVERVLRSDPAGIYPDMDFDTRDRYRRAVEGIARGSGRPELEVAQRAVERASQAEEGDQLGRHLGTYLVGGHRTEFARLEGGRETLRLRLLQAVYA